MTPERRKEIEELIPVVGNLFTDALKQCLAEIDRLKRHAKPSSNEQRYFDALRRIASVYDSADKVVKSAERRYGLDGSEALGMAYENLQSEAANAIRGKRRPRV